MMCQAEIENHCQSGLNSPLPGEGVLWCPQEKFTLKVEGGLSGFTSLIYHSLHA